MKRILRVIGFKGASKSSLSRSLLVSDVEVYRTAVMVLYGYDKVLLTYEEEV